jgi:hypothetical protein
VSKQRMMPDLVQPAGRQLQSRREIAGVGLVFPRGDRPIAVCCQLGVNGDFGTSRLLLAALRLH